MTTINQVPVYQYSQTAAAIHQLKTNAYKTTTREKYAYRSPDAQTFRNKRPPQSLLDAGLDLYESEISAHRVVYISSSNEHTNVLQLDESTVLLQFSTFPKGYRH